MSIASVSGRNRAARKIASLPLRPSDEMARIDAAVEQLAEMALDRNEVRAMLLRNASAPDGSARHIMAKAAACYLVRLRATA